MKIYRKTGRLLTTVFNQNGPFAFGTVNVIQQNTVNTNALGADGYSWAQSYQPIVDQYGKIITMVQKHNTGLYWLFANTMTEWNDILSSPGDGVYPVPVTRHAAAYDSISDKVHVLYRGIDPSDGMIYRRYSIQRDANNNITGVTKDASTNIQLDMTIDGIMEYNHPVVLFFDDIGSKGAIVCFWGAINTDGGGAMEVRATMRTLTNDSNDGNVANWTHIGIDSRTSIGNSPQCSYTAIVSSLVAAGGHPAVLRKTANSHIHDLYIFYHESISGIHKWRTCRAVWDGSAWSLLTDANDVGNLVESGSDGGYNLKGEISSKPVEDTQNDLVYFAYSTWKNNTDGDAWVVKSVNSSDVIGSPTYVYYKNAASNHQDIFITGDIMYDAKSKLLVVTYTDLPNKDTYIVAYKKKTTLTLFTGPKQISNGFPGDIPELLGSRLNNRFCVIMRDFNEESTENPPTYTPPYTGYFITVKQR